MIPQNLRQYEKIIAEIFGIMPPFIRDSDDPPFPQNIEEIIRETGWSSEKIKSRLATCEKLLRETLLRGTPDQFSKEIIVDFGANPKLTLEGILSLLHERSNQTKMLLVDRDDPQRALSYALFLREQGFTDVYALIGE